MTFASINWQYIAGGLALFLFGIKLMGDGLTNAAGTKIRDYIEKYTSNPFKAMLVGIFLTGLIQSSSGTTVIVISLVRAGLMKLDSAIGVTLGANIGTTVTAILIGFDLEYYAYFLLLIGVILMMIASRKKQLYLSQILIGFGLLFVGLQMMGDVLVQFPKIEGFNEFIVSLSTTPVIGVVVGAVITGIVQSSSAIIGVIQKLYDSNAISLLASLGLVFGANIGTTVTGVLAGIGGSAAAKRTAVFHLLFNVITSLFFLIIIHPFYNLIVFLSDKLELSLMMQVALGHFLFNLLGTLMFIPFVGQVVKMLKRLIKNKGKERNADLVYLDEHMVSSFPAGALQQAKVGVLQIAELAYESLETSQKYLNTRDSKYFKEVNQIEEMINSLDTKVTSYLLKISKENITDELSTEYSVNLQVLKNFERIADLSQNLAEYFEMIIEADERFDEDALEEINGMFNLLMATHKNAISVYETKDELLYQIMKQDENYMNRKEIELRSSHFSRLTERHLVANVVTSLFVDILGTFERIGDHQFNVGSITFNPIKTHMEKQD